MTGLLRYISLKLPRRWHRILRSRMAELNIDSAGKKIAHD
jgi:hypothetical protein